MWKNIGSPHNIREWLLSNVFVCENLSNLQFRCVQWMGKKMLLKAEGSKLCRKGNAGVNDPHVLSLISSFFWLRRIEIIHGPFQPKWNMAWGFKNFSSNGVSYEGCFRLRVGIRRTGSSDSFSVFGLFVRLNIFPIPYSISLNVRSLVP